MPQQIILSQDINAEIQSLRQANAHDKCFVLTDETTHRLCRPLVSDSMPGSDATDIVIGATDVNKTLDTLKKNKNVTLVTLEKLCKILECTPNDIVRFTE